MSSKQLPTAIAAFVRAANAHDSSALLKTLADGAVITELGEELRGDALRRWSDEMFVNSRLIVRSLDPAERDGGVALSVTICGTRPGAKSPVRRHWRLQAQGNRITAIETAQAGEPDLPAPVAAFVQATNARDLEGIMTTFADDAVVNDDLRERTGKAAIRAWAQDDVIGGHVAIVAIACTARQATCVLTAHVDGDFDQRGLPYPLIVTFYFAIENGRIIQLIILRNQAE